MCQEGPNASESLRIMLTNIDKPVEQTSYTEHSNDVSFDFDSYDTAQSLFNTVMMSYLIFTIQRTIPIQHGNDVLFDFYNPAHHPY
jgi:hypothetical protein